MKELDVLVVGAADSLEAFGAARLGAQVSLVSHFAHESDLQRKVARLKDEGIHMFDDESAPGELVKAARVALLSMAAPLPTISSVLTIAAQNKTTTILDGVPESGLPDGLFDKIDLLRPLGVHAKSRVEAVELAQNFLKRGVKAVLLEVVGEGHLIVTSQNRELWLPWFENHPGSQPQEVHDVMFAALAVALAEGHNLFRAALFANAAATLGARRVAGVAGLPGRDEVLELLNAHNFGPMHDLTADSAA
jgi:sugar/nucleoside kinase (ribokinase family)